MSEPTIDARPSRAIGLVILLMLAVMAVIVGLLLRLLFLFLVHRGQEQPPSMVAVYTDPPNGRSVYLEVPRSSIHNIHDCTGVELSVTCHALSGNTPVLVRGIDFNH